MVGDNGAVPKFFQDQKYQAKKAEVMKQRADAKQKENAVLEDNSMVGMKDMGDFGLWFKSKKSRKSGKKSRRARKSGKKSRKSRKSGKKSRKSGKKSRKSGKKSRKMRK